jgi:hypothetical protein
MIDVRSGYLRKDPFLTRENLRQKFFYGDTGSGGGPLSGHVVNAKIAENYIDFARF